MSRWEKGFAAFCPGFFSRVSVFLLRKRKENRRITDSVVNEGNAYLGKCRHVGGSSSSSQVIVGGGGGLVRIWPFSVRFFSGVHFIIPIEETKGEYTQN